VSTEAVVRIEIDDERVPAEENSSGSPLKVYPLQNHIVACNSLWISIPLQGVMPQNASHDVNVIIN